MTTVDKKVDLFKHFIKQAPLTSVLKVNGFYYGFLSDESFQRLFHFDDLAKRQKMISYIIPLTMELKSTLVNILDLEKEKLIYDMTHFCIQDKSELLAVCYDTMDIIQIKTKTFSGLDELVVTLFSELEVELNSKLDDHGFFKDIQLADT